MLLLHATCYMLHATCYTDTKIYSQRDDGRGNVCNNSGTTNPYIPSTTQSHDTNTNKKQIHVRADGPHKYIFIAHSYITRSSGIGRQESGFYQDNFVADCPHIIYDGILDSCLPIPLDRVIYE